MATKEACGSDHWLWSVCQTRLWFRSVCAGQKNRIQLLLVCVSSPCPTPCGPSADLSKARRRSAHLYASVCDMLAEAAKHDCGPVRLRLHRRRHHHSSSSSSSSSSSTTQKCACSMRNSVGQRIKSNRPVHQVESPVGWVGQMEGAAPALCFLCPCLFLV